MSPTEAPTTELASISSGNSASDDSRSLRCASRISSGLPHAVSGQTAISTASGAATGAAAEVATVAIRTAAGARATRETGRPDAMASASREVTSIYSARPAAQFKNEGDDHSSRVVGARRGL